MLHEFFKKNQIEDGPYYGTYQRALSKARLSIPVAASSPKTFLKAMRKSLAKKARNDRSLRETRHEFYRAACGHLVTDYEMWRYATTGR